MVLKVWNGPSWSISITILLEGRHQVPCLGGPLSNTRNSSLRVRLFITVKNDLFYNGNKVTRPLRDSYSTTTERSSPWTSGWLPTDTRKDTGSLLTGNPNPGLPKGGYPSGVTVRRLLKRLYRTGASVSGTEAVTQTDPARTYRILLFRLLPVLVCSPVRVPTFQWVCLLGHGPRGLHTRPPRPLAPTVRTTVQLKEDTNYRMGFYVESSEIIIIVRSWKQLPCRDILEYTE